MPKKRNRKNPSALVYWNDVENDECLKTCSLATKGLWLGHMLPMAERSAEQGVVQIGTHPCRIDDDLPVLLSRVAGAPPEVIAELLLELVNSGTAGVDEKGRAVNRRLLKKAEESARKSSAGKLGADALWAEHRRRKDGRHDGRGDGRPDGRQHGRPEGRGHGSAEGTPEGNGDGRSAQDGSAQKARGQAIEGGAQTLDGWQTDGTQDGSHNDSAIASSSFKLQASSSVSKDTGDQRSPDPAEMLFNGALRWLITSSGKDEAHCRERIGAWRKTIGNDDAALVDLMRQAERRRPKIAQPLTWIQAAVNRQPKRRKGRMQAEADFIAEQERREADGSRAVPR